MMMYPDTNQNSSNVHISRTSRYSPYTSFGELTGVNLPDGKLIEYDYDPLRRRIARKVDGVTADKYLWAGGTLLAIYDGSNNLKQRYLYADSRMPFAMEMNGSTYYLSYDQVGSLRVVTDASGNVLKQYDYDSFGYIYNQVDNDPSFDVPLRFAGGLFDNCQRAYESLPKMGVRSLPLQAIES